MWHLTCGNSPGKNFAQLRTSVLVSSAANLTDFWLYLIQLYAMIANSHLYSSSHLYNRSDLYSLLLLYTENWQPDTSVIFVLIYFLVLVLVFQLFFSFSFVLVSQYFFVLVLVLPTTKKYQTCWRRRVADLPKYRPPLVTDSMPYGRSTRKRHIVC